MIRNSSTKHALFSLIKNLSKSEARQFTLLASRYNHGFEKNYIKLFNIIRKTDFFTESNLKNHPEIRHFKNNLNYEQHRLFELILLTLLNQNGRSNNNFDIITELQKIDILWKKRLGSVALSRLKKLKKIAYQKENFEELLLIIDREIKYQFIVTDKYQLPELAAEKSRILQILQLIKEIQQLRFEMNAYTSVKGTPRDDASRTNFNSNYEKIKIWLKLENLPVTAKDELYRTVISYHKSILEFEKAYDYDVLRGALFSKNQFLIEKNREAYIQFLYLSAMNNFSIGKKTEGIRNFNLLKKFGKTLDPIYELHLFSYLELRLIPLEMYLHCTNDSVHELEKNNDKYMRFIVDYNKELPLMRKNSFCYNIAQAYFISKKYGKAKSWINIITNCTKSKTEFELYFYPMIMLLIISHEEGDDELVTSIIRSLERYVNIKKESNMNFARTLLKFLKKLFNTSKNNISETKQNFVLRLKEKEITLEQHPFLIEWLDDNGKDDYQFKFSKTKI